MKAREEVSGDLNTFVLIEPLTRIIRAISSRAVLTNDSDAQLEYILRVSHRLMVLPELAPLRERIRKDLHGSPEARGYMVMDVSSLISDVADARSLGALIPLTALCTLVGRPFRVFEHFNLWKPIIVDTGVAPERTHGVGFNPLHTDFVNSTEPPNYVCLLCIQPDPAGGGHTTVANYHKAIPHLSEDDIALLAMPSFREGHFYGLLGIGTELNPFPVLEAKAPRVWKARYTAKMLHTVADNQQHHLLQTFHDALTKYQTVFLLRRFHLLIINQELCCHGRLALGAGQAQLPAHKRRYILQAFLREHLCQVAETLDL
jgi:hypothetical protein